MLKKLTFSLLAIAALNAKAQFPTPYVVPNIDWKKVFSQTDAVVSSPTAIDANSNVYQTGYSGLSSSANLLALKYDSTGILTYSYSYNNGGYDNGASIKAGPLGHAYICGSSVGTATTGIDYIVVKLSPNGAVLWTRRFDRATLNPSNNTDEANDLCIDPIGGSVYVTGRSKNAAGNYDVVTLKLNGSNGSTIWTHVLNGVSNLDDNGTAIVLSPNGTRVYVTGSTTHSVTGLNIVTYAINATSGVTLWGPMITNGTANGADKATGIITLGTDIVVCGEITNSATGLDYFLRRYNGASGTTVYNQQYDYASGSNRATSLVRDSAGNVGVTGIALNGTMQEYHTVFYNAAGAPYGLNKESTNLAATTVVPKICNDTIAHHWYVSGEVLRVTKDIFVYQIAPSGNTSWRQYVDGANTDVDCATGVVVNGVGVVYVGGRSKNSTANYDFTTIKFNQTPCYWPPDFANQPVNNGHLYLKNKGQLVHPDMTVANEVLYYTHNTKPKVYIEQDAFNFVFNRTDTATSTVDTLLRMQCKFINSNPLAVHHEYVPKLTSYNYYLGYAQSPSITDVQGNERIFIPNFYPYIDLHYFSNASGIKYYLVVKPGASLSKVRMQIGGASSTAINSGTGRLKLNSSLGNVELNRPIAYTVNNTGSVVPIAGTATWVSVGSNIYSISPPTYTASLPLIIQVSTNTGASGTSGVQANLDYSTYYGGSSSDIFNDVDVAANGTRVVIGNTDASSFPIVNSISLYSGDLDAVILKYSGGDTLLNAAFFGGSNREYGNSIAMNAAGEVFIGGQTFSQGSFPKVFLAGASNQTVNGISGNTSLGYLEDGYLAKFSANLGTQIWGRFYGGSRADAINSICVDATGNLYYGGYAFSTDIPMINAAQPSQGTWLVNNNSDAIFGKLNTSLQLVYSTYFGTPGAGSVTTITQEVANDITVDNSGNLIGVGWTDGIGLPANNATGGTSTFYQTTRKGLRDGFIVRYSPTGVKQFGSYFGGNGIDQITRVTHDAVYDETYFAGESSDTTLFPFVTKVGAFNSRFKPIRSAFIGMMSANFNKLWCTNYGRGANKRYDVKGIAVDNSGLLYLTGFTDSDSLNYPSAQPLFPVYKDSIRSSTDGFMAIFASQKGLYHAHYFGGSSNDYINNCDVGGTTQKLYVVGNTQSSNFPIAYNLLTAALIDSTYNGGDDGFVSRFNLAAYQVVGVKQQVEFNNESITVYPNPTNTNFNLDFVTELKPKTFVKVFTLMGQLVYENEITEKNTQINCETWTNGLYLINVNNADASKTFKLIKQ